MFAVIDHFELEREVVCIAFNYVDRYLLAAGGVIDKRQFQLLAMTCLYLSIKVHGGYIMATGSPSTMKTMLMLSRGHYSTEEMESMEYDILQRLQWHVHPPTPQLILRLLLPESFQHFHKIFDLENFMIELSVTDYFFVPYKPSETAAAALFGALERLFSHSNIQLDHSLMIRLKPMETPRVIDCKERLLSIYCACGATEEDHGDGSSLSGNDRTASPVSVLTSHFR